jgi:hypothetical protein
MVTIGELREAHESGALQIPEREISWLELLEWVLWGDARESFLPSEYGF